MTGEEAFLPPSDVAGRATFTRNRVERILGFIVGAACLIFGLQAFIATFGSNELGPWHVPVVSVTFGSLLVMVLTALSGRYAYAGSTAFALVFPLTLIVWVLLADGSETVVGAQPWPWYLVNVATIAAVMAFPLAAQIVWTALIPIGYALVRGIHGGSGEFFAEGISDASFALIFGFVLLLLGRMFRSVAADVDDARATALAAYARVADAEAGERERLETAALIHDSVLSALIAAERSDSQRQRELAVAMAREALMNLADAEGESAAPLEATVSTAAIALDIEDAARSAFGLHLLIMPPEDAPVPGDVARALTLATLQAVANAVQHAEARGLSVSMVVSAGECQVVVRDSGPGMDLNTVPDDRLGIRASIFARMSAVGGRAELDSDSQGTRVTLRWAP